MASAGASLLLVCACLLAAAAALGSPDPGAPAGSRAGQEPLPEKPPAGARESRARLDTGPPEPTEPTTKPALSLNPRDTWLWFLRHSDREDRSKDRKSKPGLPRPQEPFGIQGPTSAPVRSEGRQKWQQLLRAAERLRQDAERCPAPEDEEAPGDPSVAALLTQASNWDSRARMVEAAFHCRLRENVSVERRTLHELGGYYLPQAEGAFYRGLGLNLTSGQYTVSVAGFYALAATLHVALPEQRRPDSQRSRNRLRLLICVQSRCQHNTSLETALSRPTGAEVFTVSVSGVLYLKKGQYTSVFLDNASGSPVTVRSGSQFSAIFLGV